MNQASGVKHATIAAIEPRGNHARLRRQRQPRRDGRPRRIVGLPSSPLRGTHLARRKAGQYMPGLQPCKRVAQSNGVAAGGVATTKRIDKQTVFSEEGKLSHDAVGQQLDIGPATKQRGQHDGAIGAAVRMVGAHHHRALRRNALELARRNLGPEPGRLEHTLHDRHRRIALLHGARHRFNAIEPQCTLGNAHRAVEQHAHPRRSRTSDRDRGASNGIGIHGDHCHSRPPIRNTTRS